MSALPAILQSEIIRALPSSKSKLDEVRRSTHRTDDLILNAPPPQVPPTENIEMASIKSKRLSEEGDSRTSVPTSHSVPARTAAHRRVEKIQFLSLCWCLLLAGWNDGATGPLLPRIQQQYHVNFTVVSMLFIVNCLGFISGAAANVFLTGRIGFGKTIVLGAACQLIGYALQAPAPPFEVLALGYAVNGFGIALQDAQANGYVAALQENAASKMGLLHAAYGVGALFSPIVATQFAQLEHWSFHYLTSLGIALVNVMTLIWVFKGRRQDDLLESIGQVTHESEESKDNMYKQIWRTKNVHLLAAFILIYVGVEVTTGGWIVTYIIERRHGGPSSGYVSSGFFGGLTFGRVALLWVNKKVGEYRVIYFYAFVVLALELIIWFVPSLIGNAVAVSIIGALLGPMYPIAMNHSARILPRWILTGAIGWIAGLGQAGSALIPFITGALATKFGIVAMPPFMIVNVSLLIAFWAVVPSRLRRSE